MGAYFSTPANSDMSKADEIAALRAQLEKTVSDLKEMSEYYENAYAERTWLLAEKVDVAEPVKADQDSRYETIHPEGRGRPPWR